MARHGRAWSALLLGASLVSAAQATAGGEGEAGMRHAAWRGCLHRSFGAEASLTGRARAANAALSACRDAERAYLTALSASPLLDGDDVARVRPALVERARGWLLGRGPSPSL